MDEQMKVKEGLPMCFKLYPGLFEQVRSGQFHEEEDEMYALVDQSVFNRFIPVKRRVDTLLDNQKFLIEKQVFASTFFETTAQLFEKVVTSLEKRSALGEDVSE
jgi:hypothetical protein